MPLSPRSPVRRLVAVVLLGTLGVLGAPAPWALARAAAEASSPEPAPVDPSADLLVATATTDIQLPWQSVPSAVLGVLGTRAATREAVLAFLKAQEAARLATYAAAVEAAARRGPVAAVRRAASRCRGDFECFRACTLQIESHGDYAAISPGGTYRGGWQFDRTTWNGAVSRAGYPEWVGRDPASAPPSVQDAAARQLYAERGNQPWGGRC